MSSFDPTTPLIAVGIFVAICSFCCYTSILRRSSADDDVNVLSTRPFDVGTSNGLDANIVEKFPTFIYSEVKHLTIGKGALECAVCLNEFEDDEMLKLLPKCDHVFHSECIGKWLSSRTTCPVCRDDLDKLDAQELAIVDRGSVTIEVAEEDIVDDGGGLKKSTMWSKFPRSHSTGHSLVQQGESVDRFTLNLPVQIRNEIMARTLNQTMSSKEGVREAATSGGGGEGSGGRGRSYRRLGSLDRPDRWMFYMALPMKLSKSNRFVVMSKNNESSLPV